MPTQIGIFWAGFEQGVLKGVRPLHGMTEAERRREGAGPLAGAVAASATSNSRPLPHFFIEWPLLRKSPVPVAAASHPPPPERLRVYAPERFNAQAGAAFLDRQLPMY